MSEQQPGASCRCIPGTPASKDCCDVHRMGAYSTSDQQPGAASLSAPSGWDVNGYGATSLEKDDYSCTLCRQNYPQGGQHVGIPFLLCGPGYRICKRCYRAGRDARRDETS